MVAMMDPPEEGDGLPKGQAVTPGATLSLAEANIVTDRNGIAYSNSEDGLKLAEQFAVAFKGIALESTVPRKMSRMSRRRQRTLFSAYLDWPSRATSRRMDISE